MSLRPGQAIQRTVNYLSLKGRPPVRPPATCAVCVYTPYLFMQRGRVLRYFSLLTRSRIEAIHLHWLQFNGRTSAEGLNRKILKNQHWEAQVMSDESD